MEVNELASQNLADNWVRPMIRSVCGSGLIFPELEYHIPTKEDSVTKKEIQVRELLEAIERRM